MLSALFPSWRDFQYYIIDLKHSNEETRTCLRQPYVEYSSERAEARRYLDPVLDLPITVNERTFLIFPFLSELVHLRVLSREIKSELNRKDQTE